MSGEFEYTPGFKRDVREIVREMRRGPADRKPLVDFLIRETMRRVVYHDGRPNGAKEVYPGIWEYSVINRLWLRYTVDPVRFISLSRIPYRRP